MKILQISHRVPYPLNEGGTIGIYNYTRGFSEAGHQVTLLALNAHKHRIDLRKASAVLKKFGRFYTIDINTEVRWLPAFFNLFGKKSYNVSRFNSQPFSHFIESLLISETFDIIQVEGTFVASYIDVIRAHSKAPVVLRQHNVEYQIWERLAANCSNPLKKWYLTLLARRLKNFENTYNLKFDALIPVTEDDALLFRNEGYDKPVFVSPAGIDTEFWKPASLEENPFHVYHLGALDWEPNREAVLWFIQNVWPKIVSMDKRFVLFIAGKNMPDAFKRIKIENVIMVGEVPDGPKFIQNKAISVVPLLSGSGIRLKILEAMAASKLVISTRIGAQGIQFTEGKDLLLADTVEEFMAVFQRIAMDPQSFGSVRENGYLLVKNVYSNEAVIHKLLNFYDGLIHKPH